jgi:hypothetical protein
VNVNQGEFQEKRLDARIIVGYSLPHKIAVGNQSHVMRMFDGWSKPVTREKRAGLNCLVEIVLEGTEVAIVEQKSR